jgi:hypothetical protein
MQKLILYFPDSEKSIQVTGTTTSIGRAADNTICIEDDSRVSRYHAIIEYRENSYWISDLRSINGTLLNGSELATDTELASGDIISLGGFIIEISLSAPASDPLPAKSDKSTVQYRSPFSLAIILPAILLGLALTVTAGIMVKRFISTDCSSSIKILSPSAAQAISSRTLIQVDISSSDCVRMIVYELDSVEFARVESSPFSAWFDPQNLPQKIEGDGILSATVIDKNGKKGKRDSIRISLQKKQNVEKEVEEKEPEEIAVTADVAKVEVMARSLTERISDDSGYIFEQEFLERVLESTDRYRRPGFYERARSHRFFINKAFSDAGLRQTVGYVMAMSQSNFERTDDQTTIGIWRVPKEVAKKIGYVGSDGDRDTLDPARSAEIAARYMKDLISPFGSEFFMFGVACFGQTPSEASQMSSRLVNLDEASRRNFWKMVELGIVNREQADLVVQFYAAGIVAENPEIFGLTGERRLSSLW